MRTHVDTLVRRPLLVAALGVVLLLAFLMSAASVLMLSPAVVLLLLIALGMFPSEELIARLRRALRRSRRIPLAQHHLPRERAAVRGGTVLAFALANRPPPTGPRLSR